MGVQYSIWLTDIIPVKKKNGVDSDMQRLLRIEKSYHGMIFGSPSRLMVDLNTIMKP